MMAAKLEESVIREIEKYIRMFSWKMVQVVVQSRLGQKVKTKSKLPEVNENWFGLSIDDIPEIQSVTKTAMNGQLPSNNCGMCVEISLQTSEGDKMVLEYWYLERNDKFDPLPKDGKNHVYTKMSLMLKSLIVVTRMTPAYKLSLLQGPGSFVLCYRVYMGEPNVNVLGENYEQKPVGKTETPLGTISLSVMYRTQMTISPQKSNKEGMFMVKSDHFNQDMSPKCHHKPNAPYQNGIHKDVTDDLASACEECKDDIYKCPIVTNNPPNVVNGCHKKTQSPVLKKGETCPNNTAAKQFNDCVKIGAFAMDKKKDIGQCENDYTTPEPPFSCLLKNAANIEKTKSQINSLKSKQTNGKLPTHYEKTENNVVEMNDMQKSKTMTTSYMDDFVMVDLRPPFGCEVSTDLSAFFRECPPTFNDQPTFADEVKELGDHLALFEDSKPDLDVFVKTLCSDESSK